MSTLPPDTPAGRSLLDRMAALSPAQRAALKQRLAARDGAPAAPATTVAAETWPEVGAQAPLSPAQVRFLFLAEDEAGDAQAMSLMLRIDGPLDANRLAAAVSDVVTAQAALRCRILKTARGPVQEVLPAPAPAEALPVVHVWPAEDADAALVAAGLALGREGFDLAAGPLARFRLFRCAPDLHGLGVVLHHIVADGWSAGLCLALIQDAYARRIAGRQPAPPPARSAFDEARRLADLAAGEAHRRRLDQWVDRLAGAPRRLMLDGGPGEPGPARHLPFRISPARTEALAGLSRRVPGATVFTALLAAWGAVLGRFTDQGDTTIAVAVANRPDPALDRTIGEFADLVVLRLATADDPGVDALLTRTRDAVIDAQAHDGITLAQIMEAIDRRHGAGARPAIDAAFSFLNVPAPAADAHDLRFRPLPLPADRLDFALYLTAHEDPAGGLAGSLGFRPDTVPPALAAALADAFGLVVDAIAVDGSLPVSRLALTTEPAGDDLPVVTGPDGRLHLAPVGLPGRLLPGPDRARRLSDGRLRLLPGIDGALRRGTARVHPAAVEAALRRLPGVLDAAVWTRIGTDHEARLVAAVATGIPSIGPAGFAAGLVDALPPLLRPDAVLPVHAIPRDAEGRPDRAALDRLAVPAAPHRADRAALVWVEAPAPALQHLPLDSLPGTARAADEADWLVPGDPPPPALADGGPLVLPADAPRTLDAALIATAARHPGRGILHDDGRGSPRLQDYAGLLAAARRTLGRLQAAGLRPGDRAVLVFADLSRHIEALWACILGGIRPVTVAVPHAAGDAVAAKLSGTHAHLGAPPVLTDADTRDHLTRILPQARILVAAPAADTPEGILHQAAPEDVAFIQLSSGSTGVPKCIQVTHGGVIAHVFGQVAAWGHGPDDVSMNWLPFDHVVPMLTCHLKDTVLGRQQIQAPTAAVLDRPLLWLDLIERHRVTLAWAPNFAFRLVADALSRETGRRRDLSSIRWFINAGEQVTAPVVADALAAMVPHGLRPGAVRNEFGMAELCTVMTGGIDFTADGACRHVTAGSLTGRLRAATAPGPGTVSFVDAGRPIPGVAIRIADPDGATCPEGVIGRLQARGAVTTPGYIDNAAANEAAFADAGWFDTGDLGFIADGRLVLTGRLKEMIVVRGANHYAHDVEDEAGRAAGVAATFVAATAVDRPDLGTEGIAVFYVPEACLAEIGAADDAGPRRAEIAEITARLARRLGIAPSVVVPLDRADFPKTTSGKIQRTALRRRLEAGDFDARLAALGLAPGRDRGLGLPDWFLEPGDAPAPPLAGAPRLGLIEDRLPRGMALADAIDRRRALLARLAGRDAELVQDAELVTVTPAGDVTAAAVDAFTAAAAEDLPGLHLRRIIVADGTPEAVVTDEIARGTLPMVHLTAGGRTRPVLRPARLAPDTPAQGIAPGQSWLVTGGHGGLGRALIRHLLDRGVASVTVIGRRMATMDDPRVQALSLDLAAADAGARLAALGRFDGIAHLAGLYRERPAAEEDGRAVAELAAPKTGMLPALARLLRDDGLLIAFSSVVAHLPAAGTAAYAAANAALEAEAAALRRPGGPRLVTIAWTNWEGPGMGAAVTGAAGLARGRGLLPIPPADGLASLDVVLAAGLIRAVIGADRRHPMIAARCIDPALSPARARAVLLVAGETAAPATLRRAEDVFGTPAGPGLRHVDHLPESDDALAVLAGGGDTIAAVAPRTATETALAAIWSELLPAPVAGIDADFFAAGGHSLLAARIVTRINDHFGLHLTPAALFDAPTIRALAAHVDGIAAPDPAGADEDFEEGAL